MRQVVHRFALALVSFIISLVESQQAIAGLQAAPADVEPLVAEMLVQHASRHVGEAVRRSCGLSGAAAGDTLAFTRQSSWPLAYQTVACRCSPRVVLST